MIAPESVQAAAEQIRGIANKTPVLTSRSLDERLGCRVYFKCENFQRVGAFKFRGAYNAISRLDEDQREAGVITHSSGNHAQGVALAAKLLNVKAIVVMPDDSPPNKRAATEAYGAKIVTCDAFHREEVTQDLISEAGYTLIHPYDNDHIIAGQGTAALELFDEVGLLDYLFVPVGGGGLISGCVLATQLRAPTCQVIGVEPESGGDATASWHSNEIVKLDAVPQTIADGLRTRAIGKRNFDIMRRFVSDMITVTEEDILDSLTFIWSRLKIVVEPSAAVALAPLLAGKFPLFPGSRVGVLLSGGNINVSAPGFLNLMSEGRTSLKPIPEMTPSTQVANRQSREQTPAPTIQILSCTPLATEAEKLLSSIGQLTYQVDAEEESLIQNIGDYQALIVGPNQWVESHVMKYGYNLRVIGCLGNRLDFIDVSSAKALGIEIVYLPDNRAVAIAEQTIARLLALSNRFADGRLAGKTLGLVGFGLVGRLVAQRASAFEMRILANQPRLTPELVMDSDINETDLTNILSQADFISLHIPHREETEAIIGAAELSRMKSSAFLVNTGHTDLVDENALLMALEEGNLAGVSLSELPSVVTTPSESATKLREHPRAIVSPHISTILDDHQRDASLLVSQQVTNLLRKRRTSETLSLQVVPAEQVVPHEHIDHKRVDRLMERLEEDGRLVNPPITTYWKNRYVILDGATRSSSLQRLGYPYTIVQVVDAAQSAYQLYTWYHAISADSQQASDLGFLDLREELETIEGLELELIPAENIRNAFRQPGVICYFLEKDGKHTLARLAPGAPRLAIMNQLVDRYNAWGNVERTLLTDLDRLLTQFPHMVAVAIYPQFEPEDVFDAAARGELLPAGLTRFVIPGRILRLNADLKRLKQNEPLAEKRAWFDEFLAGKLSRSRLRYYQEPVILLDE
jgi:threo-3-hydroxy-L-aspartate ammonia-lyase